ncbi:endoglucanase [Aeromonas sp. RU39B]|uniref:glycoside hydrolase family 5 protein n=1 Tax=Aeromonas sp. RU39B TaxID=1907416 RepID=UPI000953D6B0|nr:glycoside hydrolase family 5 protein [Aeromonas sp. RU39B]SIQ60991.1 endoglucanase [Aeromonas sp. RU39B]
MRLVWMWLWLVCSLVQADCLSGAALRGVNVAGAEFKSKALPGVANKDYIYPSEGYLDSYVKAGANLIRLPVLWERLQPVPMGDLAASQVNPLLRLARYAEQRNICLLVDLHNYGKFRGVPLPESEQGDAILMDLWRRMATLLKPYSRVVALGLMNEPSALERPRWASLAQKTVDRLRADGSEHLILVSGGGWSGAHSWFSGSPSNADLFAGFHDPKGRSVIELHQYADRDGSGTHWECMGADQMNAILARVSQWGREQHQSLLLGEFGVADSPECLSLLDSMLGQLTGAPWRGWSYWAAGSWWGNYPFSIHPKQGQIRPQMRVLQTHFTATANKE